MLTAPATSIVVLVLHDGLEVTEYLLTGLHLTQRAVRDGPGELEARQLGGPRVVGLQVVAHQGATLENLLVGDLIMQQ